MSTRYRLLLILIGTIKRLSITYRIVGSSEPQDRDTVVVLGDIPKTIFLTVTNEGIETVHSFLSMPADRLQADILVSSVMAAADVQIEA